MKKLLSLLIPVILLASCTVTKPLYSWHKYEISSYNYLKNNDEKSTQELIKNYEEITAKQKGSRQVVPPGIYADYGFILLQMGKNEEGNAMLEKEIALYPESKIFIDRIIKMQKK
jgi:hypothetical protein